MNIVLIGFKSCGKSTLGKKLAYFSNMQFVDTDTLAEQLYATLPEAEGTHENTALPTCREIYEKHGAAFLRELEKKVVFALKDVDNTVIATGGGVVLDPDNVETLRATGICVFMDASLALLERRLSTIKTPLFSTRSIAAMHAERYPLYSAAAHIVFRVAADEPVETVAEALYSIVHSQNIQGFQRKKDL